MTSANTTASAVREKHAKARRKDNGVLIKLYSGERCVLMPICCRRLILPAKVPIGGSPSNDLSRVHPCSSFLRRQLSAEKVEAGSRPHTLKRRVKAKSMSSAGSVPSAMGNGAPYNGRHQTQHQTPADMVRIDYRPNSADLVELKRTGLGTRSFLRCSEPYR